MEELTRNSDLLEHGVDEFDHAPAPAKKKKKAKKETDEGVDL